MDKKICGTCKQELDLIEFSLKNAKTNKRQSKCKACQKEYSKKHYLANKTEYFDKAKANNKKYKERNKDFLIALKEGVPCMDCGKKYPHYVMDFDHLPVFEKKENLSRMKNWSFSTKTLMEEISKCDLVCSNCHRERTWKRLHE
jgi:hypothetical protein